MENNMYAKQVRKTIAIGNNSLDAVPVSNKVVNFLRANLPLFKTYLANSAFEDSQEPLINQKLSTFLDSQSRNFEFTSKKVSPLYFHFCKDADLRDSRRKPDIGVFLGSKQASSNEPFFHIECKRLPTPLSGGRSEKEYVRGNDTDGGIERFKKEKHGSSIAFSAIVGYVERDSFDDWFSRVNGWIMEFASSSPDTDIAWTSEDILSKQPNAMRSGNDIICFRSTNSRITYAPIVLYHFWINFSNGKALSSG
jgi:hypothetical protein